MLLVSTLPLANRRSIKRFLSKRGPRVSQRRPRALQEARKGCCSGLKLPPSLSQRQGRPSNNLLQLNLCPTGQDGGGGTAGVRCRWHQSAAVCAQRPGRSAVTLSTDPGRAGLRRHSLPSPSLLRLHRLPASGPSRPGPVRRAEEQRGRRGHGGGTAASGEQALAAQAARAALVRRAQLAHLVLPDLAHQRVEGVLHALGTRGCSARDSAGRRTPAAGPGTPPPAPTDGAWSGPPGPRQTPASQQLTQGRGPGLCPAPA